VFALLEAAGLVDPKHTGKLRRSYLVLEQGMQFTLAIGATGGACSARLAAVGTDEDMTVKFGQCWAPWKMLKDLCIQDRAIRASFPALSGRGIRRASQICDNPE
jgi:hypothetical protein